MSAHSMADGIQGRAGFSPPFEGDSTDGWRASETVSKPAKPYIQHALESACHVASAFQPMVAQVTFATVSEACPALWLFHLGELCRRDFPLAGRGGDLIDDCT